MGTANTVGQAKSYGRCQEPMVPQSGCFPASEPAWWTATEGAARTGVQYSQWSVQVVAILRNVLLVAQQGDEGREADA